MTTSSLIPVFDGHNDVLLRLMRARRRRSRARLPGRRECRPSRSGRACAPAASPAASSRSSCPPSDDAGVDVDALMARPRYDVPLPPELAPDRGAAASTLHMASLLLRIQRASRRRGRGLPQSGGDPRCIDRGVLAAVMHIEGAEAIDPDLRMLDVLYEAGLRSIGPVWSRSNIFGARRAVPLSVEPRYGSGPDRPRARARPRLQRLG